MYGRSQPRELWYIDSIKYMYSFHMYCRSRVLVASIITHEKEV